MSDLTPSTPLDVRRGVTKAKDTAFPLRWGIIGAGDISSDWCKSLLDVPGATITAVAARDKAKAEDFAVRHNVKKACSTYGELMNDPEVDIVYIGTITPLHKEHTLLAIQAGKHVLCEKPIAESHADAAEMFDAAVARGVMLQEGMWTRFFPAVEHARVVLDSGELGDVQLVQSDFPDKCYAVQAAPFAFGRSQEVPTMICATLGESSASGAIVQYGGKGCAMLSFPTWSSEYPEHTEIICKKGRITLDPWAHHPTRVTIRKTPPDCLAQGNGHTSTSQNNAMPITQQFEYPIPGPSGVPAPGWHYSNQHGFVYQAEAIHRCLAAGLKECPQFTKEESLHIMFILESIKKQQAGEPVFKKQKV